MNAEHVAKMLVPQKTAVRRTKTEMDAWTMRMKTVCSIRWMRARTRMPAQRTTTQMVASMTRTVSTSLMMSTVVIRRTIRGPRWTGEGCYPLDRPISAIITASPENGSSLDGEVHVSWEVNDEDSDGHEVLIEIVAETAPSIVLLTCTKTAPEPGPGTCSWTFPDELPPFYRTEERYRLQMAVSSTNASPAGDRTPLNFMLAEGLTVPNQEMPATSEDAASNAASAVVWLGLLGVLAGAGVAGLVSEIIRETHRMNRPRFLAQETSRTLPCTIRSKTMNVEPIGADIRRKVRQNRKVNLEVQCHARLTIPRGKVNKNERPPVCWN